MRKGIQAMAIAALAALTTVTVIPAAGPPPPPAQVASQKPAPQAQPTLLTRQHSGWRQTGCLNCHDQAAMAAAHKDAEALRPSDCGRCHGYNGAPHEAHAIAFNPCASCHARVEHAADFKAPEECLGCHRQGTGSRD